MTAQEVFTHLQDKFGSQILEVHLESLNPHAKIAAGAVLEICTYLKGQPDLDFNHLMCLSSIDTGDSLQVDYQLNSMWKGLKICLKVDLPRDHPEVESVTSVWRTADWHEREAFDMMGIVFKSHPDLKRILCPDDWEGYPLRKDYQVQEFYHGIRVPYPGGHEDGRA